MPFKSESQRKKCYYLTAKGKAGSWNCDEWEAVTPKNKKLPESLKKISCEMSTSFAKIAKELFNPQKSPLISTTIIQKNMIENAKQEKMKGMTPIEYRNEVTSRSRGIIARNKQTAKSV